MKYDSTFKRLASMLNPAYYDGIRKEQGTQNYQCIPNRALSRDVRLVCVVHWWFEGGSML
jgi:hypothetical protein